MGHTVWQAGLAMACGEWWWPVSMAGFYSLDFCCRAIPVLQKYMQTRYEAQFEQYCNQTPHKFCPFVY